MNKMLKSKEKLRRAPTDIQYQESSVNSPLALRRAFPTEFIYGYGVLSIHHSRMSFCTVKWNSNLFIHPLTNGIAFEVIYKLRHTDMLIRFVPSEPVLLLILSGSNFLLQKRDYHSNIHDMDHLPHEPHNLKAIAVAFMKASISGSGLILASFSRLDNSDRRSYLVPTPKQRPEKSKSSEVQSIINGFGLMDAVRKSLTSIWVVMRIQKGSKELEEEKTSVWKLRSFMDLKREMFLQVNESSEEDDEEITEKKWGLAYSRRIYIKSQAL
ncbi:Pleiotropic drug resistance protein 2 [Senna tora]|uniref:Pleiotropic drug resistance protein 2 n=1 Tax=Senna tora TaxID=362788 RepID=A0A834TDQ7_9FABA|nr:Pleiotropic drug resistance protein 2 [Senna tora]